jgi:hypothetical protein
MITVWTAAAAANMLLGLQKTKEMTERLQNKMKMKNDDFDLTTERQ